MQRSNKHPTPWTAAAAHLGRRQFDAAAELYAQLGARPQEADARLQAAKSLITAGRRVEAKQQLEKALEFYRSVKAFKESPKPKPCSSPPARREPDDLQLVPATGSENGPFRLRGQLIHVAVPVEAGLGGSFGSSAFAGMGCDVTDERTACLLVSSLAGSANTRPGHQRQLPRLLRPRHC